MRKKISLSEAQKFQLAWTRWESVAVKLYELFVGCGVVGGVIFLLGCIGEYGMGFLMTLAALSVIVLFVVAGINIVLFVMAIVLVFKFVPQNCRRLLPLVLGAIVLGALWAILLVAIAMALDILVLYLLIIIVALAVGVGAVIGYRRAYYKSLSEGEVGDVFSVRKCTTLKTVSAFVLILVLCLIVLIFLTNFLWLFF